MIEHIKTTINDDTPICEMTRNGEVLRRQISFLVFWQVLAGTTNEELGEHLGQLKQNALAECNPPFADYTLELKDWWIDISNDPNNASYVIGAHTQLVEKKATLYR